MFRAAGMNPDKMLSQVRRGYSGNGGPLTPLSFSTMGGGPDPDAARAVLGEELHRFVSEERPDATLTPRGVTHIVSLIEQL